MQVVAVEVIGDDHPKRSRRDPVIRRFVGGGKDTDNPAEAGPFPFDVVTYGVTTGPNVTVETLNTVRRAKAESTSIRWDERPDLLIGLAVV